MTVKEATRKLLKDLESIGWEVNRGRYPKACLGKREFHFRPRSIIVSPGGTLPDRRIPSAKHYMSCMHLLLLERTPK